MVKGGDGVWAVERPAVKPIQNRWVMLTPEGFDYTPPKTAVRQRQLIEALQCGPVTTRDLNLLYNSMSATIKALEKRGVVVVEERRAWRGCSEQTSLSSASGKARSSLPTASSRRSRRLSAPVLTPTETWSCRRRHRLRQNRGLPFGD
ncbi:MAG: hypothetical protein ACLS3M_05075 [Collinsella sp.]